MVYVDKSTLVLVFAPDAVVLPVTLCVFFENLRGIDRLKLLAARHLRVVFRIHAYCHLKEFFIRPECLARHRQKLRIGLDHFQVALRHMLVEVYPVRSCRFVLREYRLSLAGRIRTPDGNGRHGPVIIGIVFQKAVDLVLRPFGKDIRYREVVRAILYLADMISQTASYPSVSMKSGIFQDIILAFQHFTVVPFAGVSK